MGAGGRLRRFGSGGLLGAGLGSAAAVLFAPDSGDGLRNRVRDRFRRARIAGLEAQAAKSEELIRRFRQSVNDPRALADTESSVRAKVAAAAEQMSNTDASALPTTTK